MAERCDTSFDPAQPALIVTYGNTAKKHRALNRPVLVLGRARGCDIGLVAPDVSNVHCVIVRNLDGFFLRDCSSRSGTRVNGEPVAQAILRDGDVLQIGPFSFQVYLPTHLKSPGSVSAGPPADLEKVARSRRNLARHALALRREIREGGKSRAELAAQQLDLDRRADLLREQLRDAEVRGQRLLQGERDLCCDRQTLDQEFSALRARLQQSESDLSRRHAEAEAEIRARRDAFEKQIAQEQASLGQAREAIALTPDPDERRRLDIRGRELAHFARYLARSGQRIRGECFRAAAAMEVLKNQSEGALRGKNAELEELRRENARLCHILAERGEENGSRTRRDTVHDECASRELESARSTVSDLGRALAEKDRLIEELRRKQKPALPPAVDAADELPGYEDELDAFRRDVDIREVLAERG